MKVLANAEDKFPLLEGVDGKSTQLRLLLNRAPESNEDKERRQKKQAEQNPATPPKP